MNAWIGIIGVVVGGLLTMLSASVQLRRQIHRDRQKILLTKLEELHQVVYLLRQAYKAADLEALSLAQDKELPNNVKEALFVPIEKLQMLVGIYAPELSNQLEKIESCCKEYGLTQIKYKLSADKRGAADRTAFSVLSSQQTEVQQACAEMQAAIIALARKYL